MVPNVKVKLFLISLLMFASPFGCCYSRSFIAYLSHSSSSRTGMHLRILLHKSVSGSPYTFINVLASNHAIKLVNTGTSTCQRLPFYLGQVNNKKLMLGLKQTLDLFKHRVKNHLQKIDIQTSIWINTVAQQLASYPTTYMTVGESCSARNLQL